MGRIGELRFCCEKGDVCLNSKRSRALLHVMGREDIREIRDIRGGVIMGVSSAKQRLCYAFSHIVLHRDDTVTVYVRSIAGLWKLFIAYAAVAALAVFSGRLSREGIKLWDSLAGYMESTAYPENAAIGKGAGNAGGSALYSGGGGAEGSFIIDSEKTGIVFANKDRTGVRFGYVVYADGELFESAPYAYKKGGEYSLLIYGRMETGIHEFLVETYCYFGESEEAFDVITQRIMVEVK